MAIDARELRIGNYVFKRRKKEYQVNGFDIFLGVPDNIITSFSPILLTKQWLQRAGFEKRGEWAVFDIPVRAQIRFFDWNCAECDIVQDDKFYAFKNGHIKYVHQLQNLYFALTGHELELKK